MSRERKFGIFMSVLVKKQKVQKYGQCRVNANLALFMSVVVKKAGGTKVWTMSREHARVFFLVRILLVRSQKYIQTKSRVNACSYSSEISLKL